MNNLFFFDKETTISCQCGKTHHIPTKKTIVGNSIIEQIPSTLNQLHLGKKGLIVFDENTYRAAGQRVENILRCTGFEMIPLLISQPPIYQYLEPDEEARHQIGMGLRNQPDFIIAVGSGVINDLVKFVSHRAQLPYIVVGTAPSMDGYPSPGAPMLVGGYKITFDATPPQAIFMDIDILRNAPLSLIQSGFSDLIGKTTANSDWVLRHFLQREYICDYSWDLVKEVLHILWDNADQIPHRTPDAIRSLTIALLNSGFSMALVGDSRPASGAEHLIAHYLEMMSLSHGKNTSLHGLRVGAATIVVKKMYDQFLKNLNQFDWDRLASAKKSRTDGETIRNIFGSLYPFVEKEAESKISYPLSLTDSIKRPGFLEEMKEKILEKLYAIPDVEFALTQAGAPCTFDELGFSKNLVKEAFLYSRFVRSRVTILDILDEAGVLEGYVEELIK